MQSEADPGKQTRTVRRAVVLLSGGLDSATVLAMARAEGFECHALSVRYGQRHDAELHAAARVSAALGAHEHRVMGVDLAGIGGSALTDPHIDVPQRPQNPREPTRSPGLPDARGVAAEPAPPQGIPVTYVPARNTLLLSLALGWAEVLEARHIFVGVNAVDYSGYPDCRPEFIAAFERLANLATKAGVEGAQFEIRAPLIRLSKAQIVRRGVGLGLDYGMTVSCYLARGDGSACGRCDACRLRAMGFAEAGLPDPTRYASGSHGG